MAGLTNFELIGVTGNLIKVEVSLDGGNTFGTLWKKDENNLIEAVGFDVSPREITFDLYDYGFSSNTITFSGSVDGNINVILKSGPSNTDAFNLADIYDYDGDDITVSLSELLSGSKYDPTIGTYKYLVSYEPDESKYVCEDIYEIKITVVDSTKYCVVDNCKNEAEPDSNYCYKHQDYYYCSDCGKHHADDFNCQIESGDDETYEEDIYELIAWADPYIVNLNDIDMLNVVWELYTHENGVRRMIGNGIESVDISGSSVGLHSVDITVNYNGDVYTAEGVEYEVIDERI